MTLIFAASTSSILIIGGVALATFFISSRMMGRHRKNNPMHLSYAAKSYLSDTSLAKIQRKIIQVIAVEAVNKNNYYTVIDEVVSLIGNYNPRIQALINERTSGQISHHEFNAKLRGIIDEIAQTAGIELVAKPHLYRK